MGDGPFRAIFIFIIVATIPIGVYHRMKASKSKEKISHAEEGKVLFILLRLIGTLTWLGCLVYMIHPRWLQWSFLPLPDWARWIGVCIGLLGVPFLFWVFRSLGMNVTDTVVTRKKATLITIGPYQWVRHPLYTMVGLNIIGTTLLTSSLFIGISWMIAFILIAIRTPIEEKYLIEKFGDDYREYKKRTGRFSPRFFR